ncbi:1-phosphofructokinase family hexose kinase [Rhodococcus sp. NPDC057529]|uniref:1-phosphofructokinase family hexose kinase n=1 Tax=Rhodococcus sp. NPDC057529 TaxID=3346158 RepID=UPI00366FDB9C
MNAVSAFVFAPSPLLTVTIEAAPDESAELHVHGGGQGFWIARMAVTLGLDTTLCGVFGGEAGGILESLIAREGITVRAIHTSGENGSYVHDRRAGDREPIVEVTPRMLSRHEVDDLFGASLAEGMKCDVAVLGGPHADEVIPAEVYTRLAADLMALGVPVVADLSGPTMTAALAGGLTVLKVSHEDLIEDGRAESEDPAALADAMTELVEEGARTVVLSRAGDPAMAMIDGELWEVVAPPMHLVDHRGAGDSMTAGIAAGLADGKSLTEALQLGAGAGAANITRRGLATGQRDLVVQLAETVEVRRMTLPGRSAT